MALSYGPEEVSQRIIGSDHFVNNFRWRAPPSTQKGCTGTSRFPSFQHARHGLVEALPCLIIAHMSIYGNNH